MRLWFGILLAGCYTQPPTLNGSGATTGSTTGGGGSDGGGVVTGDLGGVSTEGMLLFRAQTSLVGSGALVALADFDRDGKLDAALLPAGGNVGSMLLGAGDGTFRAGAAFSVDGTARSLLAVDRNGDGKTDLIATLGDQPGINVATLASRGDGTFDPSVPLTSEPGAAAAAVGDFDGDRKLDLAIVNESAGSVAIFLAAQQSFTAYPVSASPRTIVVSDFNGDGALDLVMGGGGARMGTLDVLLGAGAGRFTPGTRIVTTGGIKALAAARLDGDARLDLVYGDEAGAVQPLLGRGDGTFSTGAPLAVGAEVVALRTGDFNGGGRIDVAVMAGRSLLILLGRGDGSFGAGATLATLDGVGGAPDLLQAGDLDRDGKLDLVVAHGRVDVFLNLSN